MQDNINRGWVKIFRSFDKWEWYTETNCLHLFLHLLLKANHKPNKWRGILVQRGQLITSIEHLSNETGISIQSVKTVLKRLKLTNEITTQPTNRYTTITICKYDSYQSEEVEANQPTNQPTNLMPTNNQQTTNKQLTTNKNDNNYKNVNNLILKEILENSSQFFQTICMKYKISLKENKERFSEFYSLNYADNKEDFTVQNVRQHYSNKIPKDFAKKGPKKDGNNKAPVTNRPEN